MKSFQKEIVQRLLISIHRSLSDLPKCIVRERRHRIQFGLDIIRQVCFDWWRQAAFQSPRNK